ncbi:unnamed protein product [Meganyctiphanes norvegica]|uniref:GMP synthase C-terminal domain-containing protein n=1 Tax=Meganyctiphanes norvegica TaxID=48144 RepID=A0AAV2QMS7_MEGNR
MPIVLIPVHFDRDSTTRLPSCQRSLVLRPFITHDFMTGIPAVPGKHIPAEIVNKMVAEMFAVPGISRVLYDLTAKPPAPLNGSDTISPCSLKINQGCCLSNALYSSVSLWIHNILNAHTPYR